MLKSPYMCCVPVAMEYHYLLVHTVYLLSHKSYISTFRNTFSKLVLLITLFIYINTYCETSLSVRKVADRIGSKTYI